MVLPFRGKSIKNEQSSGDNMAPKKHLIQVGELAVGFSENILPDTSDLAKQKIQLSFEDGSSILYRFKNQDSLSWEFTGSDGSGEKGKDTYRATNPRDGIYFVDYIRSDLPATSVSLVMNLNKGIATSLTGTLPRESEARVDRLALVADGLEQTGVKADIKSASIDKPFTSKTPRHKTTREMIGKRVKYVYSKKDAYEHIYLNEELYTWHCLSGIEKGMADTDHCHYYKIDQKLYLFAWREKLVPTLGVVVVDLDAMKTTGKIFGYESGDFRTLINFPIGAYAELGSITKYQ